MKMKYINLIMHFFVVNIFCVIYIVSKVTGSLNLSDEKEKLPAPENYYSPSPYNLEDYCSSEDSDIDFHIDSWRGAIFHLGNVLDTDGMPKSRKIHKCKVNINTKAGFWLTAAIEHMKIRGSRDTSNRWQCSDYVQFSSPARNVINKLLAVFDVDLFNDKKSEELCGNKQLDGEHFENIFDLSTDANSFSTALNKLAIVFHQDNDEKHTTSNAFTIVVTTFQHASEEVFAAECEGKQTCYGRDIYCIDKSFICDGHVNCAFPGSGTDERLCPGRDQKPKIFNMTSIIIIALTGTVCVGIVVCIISTTICRLKWRFTNGRRRTSSSAPTSLTLAQYPTAPGLEQESTLPPYESAISSDHFETKESMDLGEGDLPPTYETLFPGPIVSSDTKENSATNSVS